MARLTACWLTEMHPVFRRPTIRTWRFTNFRNRVSDPTSLSHDDVRSILEDRFGNIWVGTEIGIVESTDGGATWGLTTNGFPNYPVWQMQQSEDEIVAGKVEAGTTSDQLTATSTCSRHSQMRRALN